MDVLSMYTSITGKVFPSIDLYCFLFFIEGDCKLLQNSTNFIHKIFLQNTGSNNLLEIFIVLVEDNNGDFWYFSCSMLKQWEFFCFHGLWNENLSFNTWVILFCRILIFQLISVQLVLPKSISLQKYPEDLIFFIWWTLCGGKDQWMDVVYSN